MESPKVENWLSRVSPTTARLYRYQLKGFLKWLQENGGSFKDYTPDELITYQQEADNGSKYDVLDLLQAYMISQKGKRYKTLKGRYAALRSFFSHNRAELPKDGSFKLKGDLPVVEKVLTVENARDMALAMNPTYRAITLCMLQAGMGVSELEAWSLTGWDSLKTQLEDDPKIIRIELPGRKKMRNIRPYYSFIGNDAIAALKVYLEKRPEDAGAIFVNQFGDPIRASSISWMWLEKSKRIGVITPEDMRGTEKRYGKNIHLLRSLFRTLWQKSPANGTVGEFLMGHQIDELGYNRFFTDKTWTQKEYAKAAGFLDIMTGKKAYGVIDEDELIQLREEVARLGRELKSKDSALGERDTDLERLKEQVAEIMVMIREKK